ncbi:hypothetical protein Bbelb_232750 [Branchiostoma belcheri]|nr:hypothetical protein Bbelb_232750 [Branchiostoma belcheri]
MAGTAEPGFQPLGPSGEPENSGCGNLSSDEDVAEIRGRESDRKAESWTDDRYLWVLYGNLATLRECHSTGNSCTSRQHTVIKKDWEAESTKAKKFDISDI